VPAVAARTEETMPTTELAPTPSGTRPSRRVGGIATRRFALPVQLSGDDTRSTLFAWLVSRALTLTLMVSVEPSVVGDVSYYSRSLRALFFHGAGIRETFQEYPLPVFGALLPPFLLGFANPVAFTTLFALSMVAADGAFTWLLWRTSGRRRSEAVTFWLWFVPLIGPTAYFRFDLMPAVLAGGAVLALLRRPALSGALTAVGAALKLWPAIMLPILLLGRTNRRRLVLGFVVTGGALALASLLAGGVERLMSPLQWQAKRGLQIESVVAGPLMLVRMFDPKGPWNAPLSLYKARELTGPGVSVFLTASTVLTIAGVMLIGVLWNRARRAPTVTVEIVGWLLVAAAAVITVTNKVLSPQYILWLGGPLAALAVWHTGDRHVRAAMRLLLVIALLTQLNYPLLYPWLVNGNFPVQIGTLVLEARNVLLVVFAWQAGKRVWVLARRSPVPDNALAG
jgi:Glycosyltransferase family 87